MRLNNRFKRQAKSETLLYFVVSAVFMVVALSYLFMFGWMVIAGLSTHKEIVLNPFEFPETLHWENYIDVFSSFEVNGSGFVDMLFNSVWFSVVAVLINQFTAITFAYCCTKYKFPGSNLPKTIILIMITLPIYGTAGATYKIYHDLGMIDNYWVILMSASGMNINFLYYNSYFRNMSGTYMEAAMLDGANDFQIYFKVMFPLARPIFGALFLTSWVGSWNSYESAMVYHPSLPTLPVGIYQFYTEMIYRGRLDIMFAACVWVSLPAIILFIVFNKVITTNVSIGGIKG